MRESELASGWWACATCTLHNPSSNEKCVACGQVRMPTEQSHPTSLPALPPQGQGKHLFEIGGGHGGPGDKHFMKWITQRRPALPEYVQAATLICVRPELMAESRTALVVENLTTNAASKSQMPGSFDAVVTNAIKTAWRVRDDRAARGHNCDVPGLASGSPFNGANQVYGSLEAWQRDVLQLAIHHLTTSSTPDDLQMALGMLMRGAQECHSRKLWAFYGIVARCTPPRSEAASDGLPMSRARILAATREFLDDEKDAAFNTHFLEPSWMYLAALRDGNPDVNVHGANTYLAALASALGVRFSREPFLNDESKGVTPFLDFRFEGGALEALQRPENLGKSWQAVRECKDPKLARNAPRTAHRWVRDGGRPIDTAELAIGADTAARKRLRPYLEAFADVFSAPRLLPRLFTRLVQSDDLTAALNEELAAFHREGLRADTQDDGSETDCRHFLWDLEGQQPAFRTSRAVLLFSRIGVVKAEAV